jgi:3-oxoacyl-(acyl-carrier-protein) synthase
MGIVSPNGCTVDAFWHTVCAGRCGIRDITRFDVHDFAFTRGGEITDFALPPALHAAGQDADLATQFMLAAAAQAMQDAGLASPLTDGDGDGIGVVLATNFGGVVAGEKLLAHLASAETACTPADFAEYLFQSCADRVADFWNLRGPRTVLSLSCSSGTAAIAHGVDLIRAGRADAILTGGYDVLSRFAWSGLSVLRTMTKDAVRPFDRKRNGTIFSEGAGALMIEELEHARQRGAPIYAEVVGCACNNNGFHMTAPAREGAGTAAVMRLALADAGLAPEAIDHINAHGTGTPANDVTETQAIKTVFGAAARRIPITSIKSTTGHLLGAAGSAEAIVSILSIRDGLIPPTTNYREPDPECDLDYVVNAARRAPVTTVLSNSAGIGGCNAAAIFRRKDKT